MNIQYFKSAWGDIKNSPGWFGKICLLALVNFIPIFGQIVTYAYLYGWAREIAWGTHEPLPKKIISNEDGKFWRRGWFVLVLSFVFSLVPYIIVQLGNYCQAMAYSGARFGAQVVVNPGLDLLGNIVMLIGGLGMLVMIVFAWVGNMRISIYDRLSAGFQLDTIVKMLRRDSKGMLKIVGMGLLFEVILGIILSIVISILVFLVVFVGVSGLINAGYSAQSFQNMTEAEAMGLIVQFISSAGLVGLLAILVISFCILLVTVFVRMLVVRAVGYWTMQFDVPRWGGQDDPLPFEAFAAQPQQPVYPVAPVAPVQPAQPQQQYGNPVQQPYGEPAQQPYGEAAQQQPYGNPAQQQPYAETAQPQGEAGQPQQHDNPVQPQQQFGESAQQQVEAVQADAAPAQPEPPVAEEGTIGDLPQDESR